MVDPSHTEGVFSTVSLYLLWLLLRRQGMEVNTLDSLPGLETRSLEGLFWRRIF